MITNLEQTGEEKRYVLGMEESYGYLSGTHARDKDAVVASALICEMAAFYKKQGKTLVDVMNDLYKEHGMYLNTLLNFGFEGAEGMEKMNGMMMSLRENTPKTIGEFNVVRVLDYKTSRSTEVETGIMKQISLPKSNVLEYHLSSDNSVIVRPSGTEPKIKIYITARADNRKNAEKLTKKLTTDIEKILEIG
ncbi:Phosphoglucomutase [bioreactor metagenome]|uniref:Phosphoglucomutase n=1 Tax=bioreactor metagenome TaxID=1076179 RepID=A0A645FA38_9ZZZZ